MSLVAFPSPRRFPVPFANDLPGNRRSLDIPCLRDSMEGSSSVTADSTLCSVPSQSKLDLTMIYSQQWLIWRLWWRIVMSNSSQSTVLTRDARCLHSQGDRGFGALQECRMFAMRSAGPYANLGEKDVQPLPRFND